MRRKPESDPTTPPAQVVLAVVLQVRDGRLQALLWQRAQEPVLGRLGAAGRHARAGRDARGLDPPPPGRQGRRARRRAPRAARLVERARPQPAAPRARDRVPRDRARRRRPASSPRTPPGTRVDDLPPLAFDHGEIVLAGRDRLRGKLSYTNVGFALAPAAFTLSELRDLYAAALGHDVSATNLKRVLLRRNVLAATGARREPGRAGGRPAEVYRFRKRTLEITDPFATLRPPG